MHHFSNTIAALCLGLVYGISAAQTPTPCATIKVVGLKAEQGFLYIAAYESAENFSKKSVWQNRIKVNQTDQTIEMCGAQFNEVALTLYQDVNANGKLDFNAIGIPTEPYGSSGEIALFSAPTWDSAKVKFSAGLVITIKL